MAVMVMRGGDSRIRHGKVWNGRAHAQHCEHKQADQEGLCGRQGGLSELDWKTAPGFFINGLKREELVARNSMILHEVFFDGLGEESGPDQILLDALARDFESFDRWRAEFSAMGRAQGGGSGWVLLTYSPRDRKLVNAWAADHTTTIAGGVPILALDMYEHSYHIDFGAKAADYVDVFMAAVNWPNVLRLFGQAQQP
ncbi:MAG: superoxide dismutase [Mesorhizobium sp.]|nr:MAG: superoxide dismutase [Mesorhizobium sp.]